MEQGHLIVTDGTGPTIASLAINSKPNSLTPHFFSISTKYKKKGFVMNFILEFIGTILHLAKSGRMIIRVNEKIEPGTLLIDSNEKNVGKVVEMIGAVRSPYVSAIPLNSSTTNISGVKVGISSLVRNNVERKRKRKRY